METITIEPDTATVYDLLRRRLRHSSTETLIQAVITLTHRIHGQADDIADPLREQREFVIAELKRRAA